MEVAEVAIIREFQELEVFELLGRPMCVAHARGRHVTIVVATEDGSGLIEGPEEVLAAAKRRRVRLDRPETSTQE